VVFSGWTALGCWQVWALEISVCPFFLIAKGAQSFHVDFLLCAVAKAEKLALFTTDTDFARYSDVIGLALFAGAAEV